MGIGRDVDDWLVEVDILLAQDSGQHRPAHRIIFVHRGLEETDQGMLDVQPVAHTGPHCAPANESVFSLFVVKYVKACADAAAADGRRGSDVYEVNPWRW